MLDAHAADEHERHDGRQRVFAAPGRPGDVRVPVGQDHVGQVRQPLGPGRTVSVKRERRRRRPPKTTDRGNRRGMPGIPRSIVRGRGAMIIY